MVYKQQGAIQQGQPGPHARLLQARIRPELHQWIQKYAHDHGVSLAFLVGEALELWRQERKAEGQRQ